MARHRRPVNVRDDGLPAVLGPLITAGGIELAVLLEVDSGMVLDAWAQDGEAATSDAEALGARHADVLRALLALPGAPPAELTLIVDGRHHLVRCVADPAGGRLALAVVVSSTPWVVRRVRRHLRQLPDAGLTTGPWILSWAIGPRSTSGPIAERPPGQIAGGALSPVPGGQQVDGPADGVPPAFVAVGDQVIHLRAAGRSPVGGAAVPHPSAEESAVTSDGDHGSSTAAAGSAAAVPDPRRGPAPPSALPPARSAGW